jgi:hypothetical protein
MASSVPTAAAAVGYDTETFGPSLTIGSNWYKANFFGINPNSVSATQNSSGSVTIAGGGDSYNEQLSSAEETSTGWQGVAFGGGAYIQATLSFTGAYSGSGGWPSFWSNDIETMSGSGNAQWQGQAAGYNDSLEADFMEYWGSNWYGAAMHNWYGRSGSGVAVSTNLPQFTLPAGTVASQPNTYGFLWVPATNTTQGYAKFFFDGTQVGNTVYWNKYNPATPPSPVSGSTAFSVLDARHLALILGSGPNNPMTVDSVQVWQASTANDLFNGVPVTPPPPVVTPSPNDTIVKAGSTAAITDASGNAWTITSGGQVAVNGVVDAITGGVIELAYVNGTIWQENNHDTWYGETKPNDSWSAGTQTSPLPTAPAVVAAPTAPVVVTVPASEGNVTVAVSNETINAASGDHTFFISGGADTFNLSGGVDTVQDTGTGGNTFRLPVAGNGSAIFSASVLSDADVFDLTAALKGTAWTGSTGTLGSYLHTVQNGANTDLLVSATATTNASGTVLATFHHQSASLSTILAHSIA